MKLYLIRCGFVGSDSIRFLMCVCELEFLGVCFGTGGGRFLVGIGTSGGCMRERRKQAQKREKASRR